MKLFFYAFYLPILYICRMIFFWVPLVKQRINFESKNYQEDLCLSFKINDDKADLAFEFSSEGEYQQVASLISDALCEGKKLELIFFSPSVEKTIQELAKKFPKQIRYLRFPILSYGLSKWMTSKTLIMVRYDLFPELLIWASNKSHQIRIVWVTFKKENQLGKKVSFLKQLFLKKASYIVYASRSDQETGKSLGLSNINPFFDFRIEQIKRRMEKRHEKFHQHFSLYPEFNRILMKYPREKRLVFGNIWPEDLFLLEKIPSDFLLVIVPHQLKPEVLEKVNIYLKSIGRDLVEINDSTVKISDSNTFLINKKGILCELYADFGLAYVGGGFGASVHSILEPLVAGSDTIACGPKTFRSTEYDLAKNFEVVTTVDSSENFLRWMNQQNQSRNVQEHLMNLIQLYPTYKKEVLSC